MCNHLWIQDKNLRHALQEGKEGIRRHFMTCLGRAEALIDMASRQDGTDPTYPYLLEILALRSGKGWWEPMHGEKEINYFLNDIKWPFQCNIISWHAYGLMYSIHHVACNVNNYFELTYIELPWENVNIRNVKNDQYPFVAPRSNTRLYKDNKR